MMGELRSLNAPVPQTLATASRATRVRFGVVAFVSVLSMITFLDRVAIASAAGNIVADLGLNSIADLKWVFSAFALAYALFEVPSGWMGDLFGPRRSLIRIVLWWSAFTALTALAGLALGGFVFGLGVLVLVRFLFGAGEAGAYPNITRALHNWLPVQERGAGQGIVWFCGKLMGGLTPTIWMLLVAGTAYTPALVPWRAVFWVFGLTGLLWCFLFARWFRDWPEEMPRVNAAEIALIRAGRANSHAPRKGLPWKRFMSSGNLWMLCLMYGSQGYGYWFYITYLPDFLEQQYHVAPTSMLGSIYKGGPLWMGAIACLIGGFLTDQLVRRTGNLRLGRRLCGLIGHGLCAICFLLCPHAPNAFVFFLVVSMSAFFTDLAAPSAWAICQDIGQQYAATVAGIMNTVAALSGGLAGWITGLVLESSLARQSLRLGVAAAELSADQRTAGLLPGYHINFYIFAALYFVAMLCWLRIDATRPLIPVNNEGTQKTGPHEGALKN
jgi:MFS transporter, ACS family, glucarate transporter